MRRGVISASVIVFRHRYIPWARIGIPERLDFDERDLRTFAEQAGFGEIALELRIAL